MLAPVAGFTSDVFADRFTNLAGPMFEDGFVAAFNQEPRFNALIWQPLRSYLVWALICF